MPLPPTKQRLQIEARFKVAKIFFDRQAIVRRVGAANVKVMSQAGAYIRRTAKTKIRYAKSPSKAGSPPHAHATRKGGKDSPLRELIFFAFDEGSGSVVIGPVPFRGRSIVPRVLEKGGNVTGRKNPRRKVRRIGDGGEVRIGGRVGATTRKNKDGRMVTYIRIRTQAQTDRANQLNEELYGPMRVPDTSIAARPYMGPSMQENLPKLPPLWANSVV